MSSSSPLRGALVGAAWGALLVAAGVLAVTLHHVVTDAPFFRDRDGDLAMLVGQFVLLATPIWASAAFVLMPVGAAIGWAVQRQRGR
ncbi:MAG: hypothetical protein AAGK21_08615 [Bacteroidota bacterium]